MNRLKELRKERSKTQKDMAEILKTTSANYSMMENEKRGIKRKYLETLADYFDVSTDYILHKSEKRGEKTNEIDEMKRLFDKFCKQAEEFIKKEKEKDVGRNREQIETFR